jgi:acetyl esterase/lipase
LSEQTRAGLKENRDQVNAFVAALQNCPAETTERAAMAEVRKCQARVAYQSDFYKNYRDRYADVVITPQWMGGVYTEVFTPRQGVASQNSQRVLINAHGGNFKGGARFASHLESLPLASVSKFKVMSVDYRMAPEFKFPAASEDVATVYREVLKTYKPQNVGIYGCSAGALLTAESIAWFQKEGLPLPGAIAMTGGAASYYGDGDSARIAAATEGGTPGSRSEHPYFKETRAENPFAFPIYSDEIMAQFPPSLLITSTRDLALSSVAYTHSQLIKLGREADLHVWEGLDHCFFFAQDVPESQDVHEVMARFFDSRLGKTGKEGSQSD